MTTIYVATGNKGKLRDFAEAGKAHDVAIEPLPGLDSIPAPEENEATFDGNARLKAIYYSRRAPGKVVLADDSGLEVDALGGRPGVRSARYAADMGYAGPSTVDYANNACLLQAMQEVPAPERTARYRCVLAAARDGEILLEVSGSVEGVVLREPRGMGGFGYDPLFLVPELDRTMAELDLPTKNVVSHRGAALRAFLARWSQRGSGGGRMEDIELRTMVGFVMTTNAEAARAFYESKLGFRLLTDDGFALAFDANGAMLRVGKAKELTPAPNTVLGWEVADIRAAVLALSRKGIAFEKYEKMRPDEHGIVTFPNGDKVAWFKDPDGNVLSLSQHVIGVDKSA